MTGDAYNDDFSVEHAIFWADERSHAIDLNSAIPAGWGWEVTKGQGSQFAGVIVGRGIIGGHSHAFALIPRHGRDDY